MVLHQLESSAYQCSCTNFGSVGNTLAVLRALVGIVACSDLHVLACFDLHVVACLDLRVVSS